MKQELILVSSITYAIKAKTLLERAGFRAYTARLPRNIQNVGCGYCVYVTRGTDRAEQLLRKAGIRVLGRYGGDVE